MTDSNDSIVEVLEFGPACHKERSSGLLRTCKAIYNEALPILYGSHSFDAPSPGDLLTGLKVFGAAAQAHIKSVRIRLDDAWYDESIRYYEPCKVQARAI